MTTWYCAPDATTTPGVTVVTSGASYGLNWTHAAAWSTFASLWSGLASGDTIIFLAGRYLLSGVSGGWATKNITALTSLTLTGQKVDGTNGHAEFVGSRDWPWPLGGNASASSLGETFIQVATTCALTVNWFSLRNMQWMFNPNRSDGGNLGAWAFNNVNAQNFAGFAVLGSQQNGRHASITFTNFKAHGYTYGITKAMGAVTATDIVGDSENMATSNNVGTAQSTYGINVYDSYPLTVPAYYPATVVRAIFRNHQAGNSGSGYGQGDGIIVEENVYALTATDVLALNNGDRGIDMKAAGTLKRISAWGNGRNLAHHMDNLPVNAYLCNLRTPNRGGNSNTATALAQVSGGMNVYQSALFITPTAAQVAANGGTNYVSAYVSVDTSKFQHSNYGALHIGSLSFIDCRGIIGTTAGAAESITSGSSDNAREMFVANLTPGSTPSYKVRACDQAGNASAYSATAGATLQSGPTGDVTGPAAPTGVSATNVTASSVQLNFTLPAQDAGTAYISAIPYLKFPGDAAPIPALPGRAVGPIVINGLAPATAYTMGVAVMDCAGNVGTLSSTVNFTTSAGTPTSAVPATPGGFATDSAWIEHPSMIGYTFNLPASGTVAYYELATSGGTVVCRSFPTTNRAVTYSTTNYVYSTV